MSHLSNVITELSEPYPPVLRDARTFQAAASELLDSVRAEQAPDLNNATLKTLAVDLATAVEFDLARDVKVKHAEVLVKIAAERTNAAEMRAAILAEPSFASQFDAAATVLVDVIGKLGGVDPDAAESAGWTWDPKWTDLRAALADVEKLSALRDDFQFMAGGGQVVNPPISIPYERNSRCAILPDANTSQVLERASNKFGWHASGYWLAAAQTPGVVVRWQTGAEQRAQAAPAAVARRDADLRAHVAAREAAFAARVSA